MWQLLYAFLLTAGAGAVYRAHGAAPAAFRSVTYIVDACGSTNGLTAAGLRGHWYDADAPAGGLTLQGYMESCSYGRMSFRPEDNVIVDRVAMPCAETSRCDFVEWQQVAQKYAVRQGVNVADYDHTIFLTSRASPDQCGAPGLGTEDCKDNGFCMAYVSAGPGEGVDLGAVAHELGHNLGLAHSGIFAPHFLVYDDWTSGMGAGGTVVCYNAPQLWGLRWADPVSTLSASNLPAGRWQAFTLPPSTRGPTNMVIIRPDWAGTPAPAVCGDGVGCGSAAMSYYVSYRTAAGYDVQMRDPRSRVVVYSWNGTRAQTTQLTIRLAELDAPGDSWNDASWARTLVRFDSVTSDGQASVRVCRYGQDPSECGSSSSSVPAAEPATPSTPRRLSPPPRVTAPHAPAAPRPPATPAAPRTPWNPVQPDVHLPLPLPLPLPVFCRCEQSSPPVRFRTPAPPPATSSPPRFRTLAPPSRFKALSPPLPPLSPSP
jgi:hypothetical protein